ncbi:MAG: Asp-tRNA(Asn)/Glu-tRNA(Gln) amidotransferase GatCAB subunit A, partial [Deltaproteobacteria bacterium]
MELCDHSAAELAEMLRKREVSAREITESVFRRMDEREETVNAFITRTRDSALEQADRADARFR